MAGNTQSSLEQPPQQPTQTDNKEGGGGVQLTGKKEITFSPQECSVQGGGHISVTFPEGVPGGSVLLVFEGSHHKHTLTADKMDEHTVSALLPAHEQAEVVSLKIFHLPDSSQEDNRIMLIDDTFVYTDPTGYMAELLVQSVTDTQAVPLLYSVLPPLATYGPEELRLFDMSLTNAVKNEKLPDGWSVLGVRGKREEKGRTGSASSGNTLLHFASYSRLPELLRYLLSLPGGKEAINVANDEQLLPLHLAQQNGCQEIVQLITDAVKESKPLAEFRVESPSEQLRWLRYVDSDWISQHTSTVVTNDPAPPASCTSSPVYLAPAPVVRRKSTSVVEQVGGGTDTPTLLLDQARRRNWSRVVGNRHSRSIDTGLNELHRISAELLLQDRAAELRVETELCRQHTSSSSTSSATQPSGRISQDSDLAIPVHTARWQGHRTSSCPTLCEDVSAQLTCSSLTSPELIGRFSATPSVNGEDASAQNSPTLPHTAIQTSTSNSESVSPLTIPALEDASGSSFPLSLAVPKVKRPTSARLPSKELPRMSSDSAAYTTEPAERKDEEERNEGSESPVLASISAPDLLIMPDEEDCEEAKPSSPKETVNATSNLSSTPQRKASPQLSSKSFSGKQQRPVRGHKKSFSVSGVKVFLDEADGVAREEEGKLQGTLSALSVSPGEIENRSRGSSLLSTSSKTGSSASDVGMEDEEDDDEEDEEEEEEDVEDTKVNRPTHLLKEPITLNENKFLASVVTNIDDYSASSDDDDRLKGHKAPLWEKLDSDTTPTNTLSFSTRSPGLRGRRGHKIQTEDDVSKPMDDNAAVNLSDIDVRMDSLNNSQSAGQMEHGLAAAAAVVSNGVSPSISPILIPPTLRRESCPGSPMTPPISSPHPNVVHTSSSGRSTPTARETIGHLRRLLLDQESGDANSPSISRLNHFSDDSDREGTPKFSRKKVQTLPSGRNTPPPRISRNKGSTALHSKVSRNTSSASDSVVFNSSTPHVDLDISSLEFNPPDPSSPCNSPREQRANQDHPPSPSPLFVTKSPRNQSPLTRSGEESKTAEDSPLKNAMKIALSPLEKHVSKSADNLLLDDMHNKEPERSAVAEDAERAVKHLRFKEDDEDLHQGKGKKNKGAEKMVDKEPKQRFKLFRRDSKRTRMSKNDSNSSLEACSTDEDPAKKYQLAKEKLIRSRPPPIQDMSSVNPIHVSPVTKPRSATIHGDCSLSHSASFDLMPQIPLDPRISPRSPYPEDIQTPVSPMSKTEGGEAMEPETASIILSLEDHPELELSVNEEKTWYQTIDRRLRKSMSKHEKARQGAIYDLVRTERHFLRSLLVMQLVFRDKLKTELKEDDLDNLFPYLDQLVSISRGFSDRLVERQQNSTNVISDISDILLDQFTGEKGKDLFDAFSGFVCLQPAAVELYKELVRKKPKFIRLMNGLYTNKHCERRKLPDFYLLITQRTAKYVEITKRIVKETEALGLHHLPRLKQSNKALVDLVEAMDDAVYNHTRRKELEDIQSRLEVNVSHTKKGFTRKELKRLDLLAQDRKLLKKGDGVWQGHGKQLNVLIVLVTDCLVLLTEKDQKLNIASLLDSKYPVIKLYDLHVRVNASVKSGVQLLLLEQGEFPEMFRLEFITKKMAKEWEETLNKAVEYCRNNNLTCDCLSADSMMSGDDEVKGEEEEPDNDRVELPVYYSPTTQRRLHVQESIDLATRLLSTEDPNMAQRHLVASSSAGATPITNKNRPSRSATLYEQRRGNEPAEVKKRLSKKTPERGKTMKEKERGGAYGHDTWEREKQTMLECISKLKDSIDYLLEQNERKDKQIEKLQQDILDMKQERQLQLSDSEASPVMQRSTSSRSSFGRPHSVHYDLLDNPPDFSHLSPSTAKRSKVKLAHIS